jgi:hypothetical protein
MRLNVAVDGGVQSVTNTGSQTTNTRIGLPANRCKMLSDAEDPCKQIGQVGDKSNSMRVSSLAALNAFLISETFDGVRL